MIVDCRIPNVAVTSVFMCFMWAAMDFNMPQLQLHMSNLDASPILVGIMFMIMAVGYSLLAPLIGLFAKTTVNSYFIPNLFLIPLKVSKLRIYRDFIDFTENSHCHVILKQSYAYPYLQKYLNIYY